MNCKLLILGAGTYALLTREIAESTGLFREIAFLDDGAETAPDGTPVLGRISDLKKWSEGFSHAFVAIGNPAIRLKLTEQIEQETACQVATIISPLAYVAPSAEIAPGCMIEPFATVHTRCVLEKCCLVSAGAVINHCSRIERAAHVDCNATVGGYQRVPACEKIPCGSVLN